MAHHGSYIVAFVDYEKDGHHEKAMPLCEEAKKELAFLKDRMNIMDKKKFDCLDRFIDDIRKGKTFSVTADIILAKTAVEQYYQEENRKTQDQTKQPILNIKQETQGRKLDSGNIGSTLVQNTTSVQNDSRTNFTSMVQNKNQTSLSQSSGDTRKEQEEIKVDVNVKHERKQDLTVVERGFKAVAIAFYNLFDDEWGSAFEELDDNITEKEKVQILLEVVQNAYDFNKGEKERLLKEAEDSAKAVVNSMGSEQKWKCDSTGAKDFLISFVYENALFAVPQLQMTFRDTKVEDMNKKWSEFLKKRGIINFQINATYIDKCVLLTWLICIEDPPIHMSYGKVNDELDTKLYEPFLKKGKYIDYIAWPALQHTDMNGSVLVKGRARGKDKCD